MSEIQQTIPNYKNGLIIHDPVNSDTMELLKRIKIGHYKALGNNEGINMRKGTVYVINNVVYRLTGKGLYYFEKIRKNHPLTYRIKELLETENWVMLESTYSVRGTNTSHAVLETEEKKEQS